MHDGPATRLLRWHRAAGRKLPWRTPFPRDPYRTLVAEVMAQQTQIDRVVPAYARFLAAFPTLEDVAAASEDHVLRLFTGLGYYRRARLLHAACRAVAARGRWPGERAELARLPGLGAYTSAALAAFCFGGDDPPVDGNLARVAARVGALAHPSRSTGLLRAAGAFARALHAEAPTPVLWEALMDLGSTVCTPAAPTCHLCPLADACRARSSGRIAELPVPAARRAAEPHTWAALWVRRADGRVLVRRVPAGPLLAGLWLPPFGTVEPDRETPRDIAQRLASDLGLSGPLVPLPPVRHAITHRRITVHAFRPAAAAPGVREASGAERWVDPLAADLATSSLLAKLARAAERR